MEGGRAGDGSQAARSQSWSSGLEQVLPAEAKDRPHLEDRGRGPPALQLSVTPTPPWGPRLHVGCEAAVKRRSGPSTPTGPLPGGQKYALKLEFYANTYRTDFLLPCVIIVQLPGLPGGGGLGSGVCCRWHALDGHSLGPEPLLPGAKASLPGAAPPSSAAGKEKPQPQPGADPASSRRVPRMLRRCAEGSPSPRSRDKAHPRGDSALGRCSSPTLLCRCGNGWRDGAPRAGLHAGEQAELGLEPRSFLFVTPIPSSNPRINSGPLLLCCGTES